jgi:transglutaminase-like putative cysteine protease
MRILQGGIMLKQGTLLSIFVALFFSVLLHSGDIPTWTVMVPCLVMVWRYFAFKRRVQLPNAWVKGVLVVGGFAGVFVSHSAQVSIEAMITLLVAGVGLKPLEVQKQSDSYVLVFLCFLLQGMHFLFEDTPLHYFYVLLCFLLTIWALIMVNQNADSSSSGSVLKYSANFATRLFLLSLPLTVFLFFVLPRLGPLWSLNISTKTSVVGLSESMSPGDVSRLGQSDELAFRVTFDGDVPPMSERYWRAIILDRYDGVKWTRYHKPLVNWSIPVVKDSIYKYEIIAQPHDKRWLFSMSNPSSDDAGVGLAEDGTLVRRSKMIGVYQYSASSNGGYIAQDKLSWMERQVYLQTPVGLNVKAQQLAAEIAADSGDVFEVIDRFKRYFFDESFFYTLSPGELSTDSRIDEFLFESKKGFCAHYAGAFVFMMRTLGVPARVVAGYQGGEKNEVADYYSVYQYDAHAWAEVWLEGKGWYRVDPTGWVSPERVEQGIEQAVAEEFTGFKSQSEFIRQMRAQMQALNFYWQDWMLSYKGENQQKLLSSIMGNRSPIEMFVIIALGFGITIGLIFVFLFWRSGIKRNRMQKLHNYWLKRLEKKEIQVHSSDSFSELAAKTSAFDRSVQTSVLDLKCKLEALLYQRNQCDLSVVQYLLIRRMIRIVTR